MRIIRGRLDAEPRLPHLSSTKFSHRNAPINVSQCISCNGTERVFSFGTKYFASAAYSGISDVCRLMQRKPGCHTYLYLYDNDYESSSVRRINCSLVCCISGVIQAHAISDRYIVVCCWNAMYPAKIQICNMKRIWKFGRRIVTSD